MDIFMTVKRLLSWKPVEIAFLAGLAVCLLTGGMAMETQQQLADRMIRLHVLANSDSEADQALKLEVRDAVTERTEVLLEHMRDRQEAERILRRHLTELEQVAEDTVRAAGYAYDVNVELSMTDFPTKEYDGFSLPAGEYLALRVLIGEAAGQNWLCVVFPPLCTAASSSVAVTALAAGMDE
jgi:stage II sporulation protein R